MSFSPPALPLPPNSPFAPAQNVVTVAKVATLGSYTIYSITDASGASPPPHYISLPSNDTPAQVNKIAAYNVAWQKLLTACVTGYPGAYNPADVVAAQNWSNLNLVPLYS
jgi:hypothetical protein